MKVCLLNECEECGRRWSGELLRTGQGGAVAVIIDGQHMAPPGCYECNPEPWERAFRFAENVGHPYKPEERRKQRLAGEGFSFLDGRLRVPSEIPYPWREGRQQ